MSVGSCRGSGLPWFLHVPGNALPKDTPRPQSICGTAQYPVASHVMVSSIKTEVPLRHCLRRSCQKVLTGMPRATRPQREIMWRSWQSMAQMSFVNNCFGGGVTLCHSGIPSELLEIGWCMSVNIHSSVITRPPLPANGCPTSAGCSLQWQSNLDSIAPAPGSVQHQMNWDCTWSVISLS